MRFKVRTTNSAIIFHFLLLKFIHDFLLVFAGDAKWRIANSFQCKFCLSLAPARTWLLCEWSSRWKGQAWRKLETKCVQWEGRFHVLMGVSCWNYNWNNGIMLIHAFLIHERKKSCKGSTCDFGQICDKISHLERECFECKNCMNVRNHTQEVKPGGFVELEEECWHVRVDW